MSKIVYLHIGQHKTGTSSIQNWLWGNKAALVANGCLLPETGFANGAHHGFFYALQGIKGFSNAAEMLETLAAEIRATASERIILTSEEFERLTVPMVSMMMRHLSDFDVRPILYIRRQDSYLLSDYGQQIKMGAALAPFSQYIENPTFPDRFNLLGLIGNWVNAGLLTRGHIAIYDALGSRSVIEHFCDIVGLSDLNAQMPAMAHRDNASWTYQQVDLVRRISVQAKKVHGLKAPELQQAYQQCFDAIKTLCLEEPTPLWPTRINFNRIASQYRDLNVHAARLARLSPSDTDCLTFKTGTDRLLEEKPEFATDAQVKEGMQIALDTLGR